MMKEIHGGNIYKFDEKMYDFSANLNPLGMPDECKSAIKDNISLYENYPDPFNRQIKAAISSKVNLPESYFCFGNGAADIIFRIVLAFKPKKALIVSPTFAEYAQALSTVNCHIDNYMLTDEDGFNLNVDSFINHIDDNLDIVFLCNPNNPTGIVLEKEDVLKIATACKQVDSILVVDECFSEFLSNEEKYSIVNNIEHYDNTIILKAFTKIYAMAGLRLGYSICSNHFLTEKIEETLQPWSVSTVASKAGCAALELHEFVDKTKKYIEEERNYLLRELSEIGVTTYNSKANYIFFRCEDNIVDPLISKKIIIRSCKNYVGLDERYYRIAVRTHEENQYFIQSLKSVIEEKEGNL